MSQAHVKQVIVDKNELAKFLQEGTIPSKWSAYTGGEYANEMVPFTLTEQQFAQWLQGKDLNESVGKRQMLFD